MHTIAQKVKYIVKKSTRASQMRLAVHRDSRVVVTAPLNFSTEQIENFVSCHAHWIFRKVGYFRRLGPATPMPRGKKAYKQHKETARAFISGKIREINKLYNFSFGKIFIKNHKSRWGSCSIKKNLNFNYKIIFLPERLAEYIVAHELCHLGEFNHSHKFWKLVSRAFPDCKQLAKQVRRSVL